MRYSKIINVADVRIAARRALPKDLFEYVDGGAEDEITLKRNRADFERLSLIARGASGVKNPDLATTVLGRDVSMPVILAPCGQLSLVHPHGDLAATAAARDCGTVSVVSSGTGHTLEDIGAVSTRGFFQLYKFGGREIAERLVLRAKTNGFSGLFVTVDTPISGNRENNRRSGYTRGIQLDLRNAAHYGPQLAVRPRWAYRFLVGGMKTEVANVAGLDEKALGADEMASILASNPFTWDDVKWIRDLWPDRPMVVKGIFSKEDAVRAMDAGADGVVVSNHGGRQLDGAPSTISMLPEIVNAIGDRGEVLLDGGVRRGSDVVKALASGARAVLIGRPYVYGLAVGGTEGVNHVLHIFREEISRVMTLIGCATVGDIDSSFVRSSSETCRG